VTLIDSASVTGLVGEPRVTQIWLYASLAERSKARSHSVADGIWPPEGGPTG
jgi:hypothetical protein